MAEEGRPGSRLARGLTSGLTAVCLVLGAVASTAVALRYLGGGPAPAFFEVLALVIAITYGGVGGIVALRRTCGRVGSILLAIGIVTAFTEAADLLAVRHAPAWQVAGWVQQWTFYLVYPLAFSLLLVLFPSGRPSSRGWSLVAWTLFAAQIPRILIAALAPGAVLGHMSGAPIMAANPAALLPASFLASAEGQVAVAVSWALPAAGLALAALNVVQRWRSSRGVQGDQLKWLGLLAVLAAFAFGLHFLSALLFGDGLPDLGGIAMAAVLSLGIPLAIAAALTGYHLDDIDTVLNRTVVYGLLTAALLAMYGLAVSGLDLFLQQRLAVLASLAGTALVAVAFAPLRSGIQGGVDLMIFGARTDPYKALAKVTHELARGEGRRPLLEEVAAAIARSLAIPYCEIVAQRPDESPVASGGVGRAASKALGVPLLFRGQSVGVLRMAPGDERPWKRSRSVLLAELAGQAAVAANSVIQASEVEESRSRILATRESERRRLRRDLHDGLGPALAAQTLKAGAARMAIATDPSRAEELLQEIERDGAATVTEIRRLVHALRPPALDELGLAGALREVAGTFGMPPRMVLDLSKELPVLPPAVEEATLRIAQEALTNVRRHANARECRLALVVDGDLRLTVEDDGVGIGTGGTGLGLASMRERAAELGGLATIGARETAGTIVDVRIPLRASSNG